MRYLLSTSDDGILTKCKAIAAATRVRLLSAVPFVTRSIISTHNLIHKSKSVCMETCDRDCWFVLRGGGCQSTRFGGRRSLGELAKTGNCESTRAQSALLHNVTDAIGSC